MGEALEGLMSLSNEKYVTDVPSERSGFFASFGPSDFLHYIEPAVKGEEMNDVVQIWKNLQLLSVKGNTTIRNVLEQNVKAQDQCNAVYSEIRDEKAMCWLCGFTIEELGVYTQNPWTLAKPNFSMNGPQCEHLIPVSAAMMYFHVADRSSGKLDETDKAFLSKNYKWSHKVCNGLKSDILFINLIKRDRTIPTRSEIQINRNSVTTFLVSLYTTLNKEHGVPMNILKSRFDGQVDKVLSDLIPITRVLKNIPSFNVLIGISKFIDNLEKVKNARYGGKKRKHTRKTRRRS